MLILVATSWERKLSFTVYWRCTNNWKISLRTIQHYANSGRKLNFLSRLQELEILVANSWKITKKMRNHQNTSSRKIHHCANSGRKLNFLSCLQELEILVADSWKITKKVPMFLILVAMVSMVPFWGHLDCLYQSTKTTKQYPLGHLCTDTVPISP